MSDEQEPVIHKWVCIALDETSAFSFAAEDSALIAKVEGVYFYDENEVTYCCSANKTHFLRGLRHSVTFKDHNAVPEATRERIQSLVEESYPEDGYFDFYEIKAIPETQKVRSDNTDWDEEQIRECWQGNHVI